MLADHPLDAARDAHRRFASTGGLIGQPWFDEFAEKLSELLALEEDWSGYGEKAIDTRCAARAVGLVALLCPQGPAPWAVPVYDGSIQLEWHDVEWRGDKGGDIEVEVPPEGPITAGLFEGGKLVDEVCATPGERRDGQWVILTGWFAEVSPLTAAAVGAR